MAGLHANRGMKPNKTTIILVASLKKLPIPLVDIRVSIDLEALLSVVPAVHWPGPEYVSTVDAAERRRTDGDGQGRGRAEAVSLQPGPDSL